MCSLYIVPGSSGQKAVCGGCDLMTVWSDAGSVDIECGCRLYQDLKDGEKSLVVASHLHLLYLVTPYDLAHDITPSWMIYMHQVSYINTLQ